MSEPVFPTFVPALYQHLVETVGGRKVYVSLHILIIGAMTSVGFCFGIVRFAQLNGRKIVRICPCTLTSNHFPPYAYILHRFNPGNIFISARLIQIQSQLGSEDIARIVTYNHRTPRRLAGSLHITFITYRIGCQPRFKNQVLIIQVQVHARVVYQSGFVQIDIQAVSRFHLKRSLYACRRELRLRRITGNGSFHQAADFREFGLCKVILLRIVVTRNPECLMVTRHGKLGTFFFDNEVIQILLQGELITKPETIVEKTETDNDITVLCFLVQRYGHFIIVVADLFHFTPHRFPCFIECGSLGIGQSESVHQSQIVLQFQTEL